MRRLFFLGLLFPLFLFVSCSEEEENDGGLTVTVSGRAIVIPESPLDEDDLGTCYDTDVAASRFALRNIQLQWNKIDRDLRLIFIKIEMDGGNISPFRQTVADEQIDDLFEYTQEGQTSAIRVAQGFVGAAIASGSTTVPTTVSVRSPCTFHVGGLAIQDTSINFTETATITVLGIAEGNATGVENGTAALGDEVPVRATTTVRVEYNLN